MTVLYSDLASTTLAGAISNTATTALLAPGTGSLFPNPTSPDFFRMTFTDAATGENVEIVHVTARSGDTVTIIRGQDGTTGRNWLAGDIAENRLTAEDAAGWVQSINLPVPLPVPLGGTGDTALTSGQFLIGNGTGPVNGLASPLDVPHGGTGDTVFGSGWIVLGNGTGPLQATAKVPFIDLPGATVIFTQDGPYSGSFTVPANVFTIFIECLGGGGGGAGQNSVTNFTGGGGGAGGYTSGWFSVVPGDVLAIVVGGPGTPGANGASGTDGGSGGTTSVGSLTSSTGGQGGQSTANAAGGAPGLGTGGSKGLHGGYGTDGDGSGLTNYWFAGNGGASAWGGGTRGAKSALFSGDAALGSGGGGAYQPAGGVASEGNAGAVLISG